MTISITDPCYHYLEGDMVRMLRGMFSVSYKFAEDNYDRYSPERWLALSKNYHFLTFIAGPRAKIVAIMEMKTVLA